MIMKPNWNYVPRFSHFYAGKPVESTFLLFLHSAQIMAILWSFANFRNLLFSLEALNVWTFTFSEKKKQGLKWFLKPFLCLNEQTVDVMRDAIFEIDVFAILIFLKTFQGNFDFLISNFCRKKWWFWRLCNLWRRFWTIHFWQCPTGFHEPKWGSFSLW